MAAARVFASHVVSRSDAGQPKASFCVFLFLEVLILDSGLLTLSMSTSKMMSSMAFWSPLGDSASLSSSISMNPLMFLSK